MAFTMARKRKFIGTMRNTKRVKFSQTRRRRSFGRRSKGYNSNAGKVYRTNWFTNKKRLNTRAYKNRMFKNSEDQVHWRSGLTRGRQLPLTGFGKDKSVNIFNPITKRFWETFTTVVDAPEDNAVGGLTADALGTVAFQQNDLFIRGGIISFKIFNPAAAPQHVEMWKVFPIGTGVITVPAQFDNMLDITCIPDWHTSFKVTDYQKTMIEAGDTYEYTCKIPPMKIDQSTWALSAPGVSFAQKRPQFLMTAWSPTTAAPTAGLVVSYGHNLSFVGDTTQ
jgi:hypothetical protein